MSVVGRYLRDLWKRKGLLVYLTISGLKSDTRNTALGYFWWLLDPAIYLAVFIVVRVILRARPGENIAAFLAIGLVVFEFFSTSFAGGARSISSKAGMITQIYLPKAVFPFGLVLTNLINFLFGLITVAVVLLVSGVDLGRHALWLPLLIVVQTVFNIALAMIMGYVAAFIRDLERVLGRLVMVLRFTSPILFDVSEVPEQLAGFVKYNPIAWLAVAYRDALLYNRMPDMRLMAYLGVGSLVAVGLLVVFYAHNEHRIIKVL